MDRANDATIRPPSEPQTPGGPSDRLLVVGAGGVVLWVAIGLVVQLHAATGGALPRLLTVWD